MAYPLIFDIKKIYNSIEEGITIPAILIFGENIASFQAKVDPGAQVCLFQREIGEQLGIDIENGPRISLGTLAGSIPAFGHSVTLHTLGLEFDSVVYFAADYGLQRNLLGRDGWLQKVRLGIVDYETTIYLSDYNQA
jgi:hypothetical protein